MNCTKCKLGCKKRGGIRKIVWKKKCFEKISMVTNKEKCDQLGFTRHPLQQNVFFSLKNTLHFFELTPSLKFYLYVFLFSNSSISNSIGRLKATAQYNINKYIKIQINWETKLNAKLLNNIKYFPDQFSSYQFRYKTSLEVVKGDVECNIEVWTKKNG